jgi:hypothetical protein
MDIRPSMSIPDKWVCNKCSGSGNLPVTKDSLAHEALTLTALLTNKKYDRRAAYSTQSDMEIVTRLQAIEDEYYRLGGVNFPV